MIPLLAAIAPLLLAALAEWLHLRRIRVVARLAFGPDGGARPWTRAVPALRALSLAAITWGLATLFLLPPAGEENAAKAKSEPTRLVFVGDLSPSMYLQDAGPDGKQTRLERMRDVVD